MVKTFRVIDSGVREGRLQIAFDQALIELHKAGRSPDTVRFLRFPPTVLIGRHQAIRHEVKVEHCRANGIGLARRITGGGAIFLEENQVGWELVLSRARLPLPTLADYTREICEAVAYGLSQAFSIEARFRPRNDIEVGGQKLCGTGGFFDGDTLIYQGTVLVDVDPARMMACLNMPKAKHEMRDLDRAENRITTLKALTGTTPTVAAVHQGVLAGLAARLGIVAVPGTITAEEEALTRKLHDEEIGRDEFVFSIDDPSGSGVLQAACTGPGGTVTVYLRLEGPVGAPRIREILLTGDFFVTPPRMIYDLEAMLRGVEIGEIEATVKASFERTKPDLLTLAPADFARAVRWAATGQVPAATSIA